MSRKKSEIGPVVNISNNQNIEALRKALRPFANMACEGDADYADMVICCRDEFSITYGDLIRAKKALVPKSV